MGKLFYIGYGLYGIKMAVNGIFMPKILFYVRGGYYSIHYFDTPKYNVLYINSYLIN